MSKRLVLANRDYRRHTTNEGDELQRGLESAGWTLCGLGYDDRQDVREILDHYGPEAVFVQDKRDWDSSSAGCFDKKIEFENLGHLARHPGILKVAVVKDAGTAKSYQRGFCEEIAADAVAIYYHEKSVLEQSPWLSDYRLVRMWHTVDADVLPDHEGPRARAIVSGAWGGVYPVRQEAFERAIDIGCDVMHHPGYGNRGTKTPQYLQVLAGYRVHIATASKYGFALRKIIESVACGCTPVTTLPAYDVLPEIDGALLRIPQDARWKDIREAVDQAYHGWNLDERVHYAEKARTFYDYRAMGRRTSEALLNVRVTA